MRGGGSVKGAWLVCLCCKHADQAPGGLLCTAGATVRLRLIEQVCGCSVVRGGGGVKGAWLVSGSCGCSVVRGGGGVKGCVARQSLPLALRPGTLEVALHDGSRHEAPTDRASLRLLRGARRMQRQMCVLVYLCLWHSDQACGCSVMRGGGGVKGACSSLPQELQLGIILTVCFAREPLCGSD